MNGRRGERRRGGCLALGLIALAGWPGIEAKGEDLRGPEEMLQEAAAAIHGADFAGAMEHYLRFEDAFGAEADVAEVWREIWEARVSAAVLSGQTETALRWLDEPAIAAQGLSSRRSFWRGAALLESGDPAAAQEALADAAASRDLGTDLRAMVLPMRLRAACAAGQWDIAEGILRGLRETAAAGPEIDVLEWRVWMERGDLLGAWEFVCRTGWPRLFGARPSTAGLLLQRLGMLLYEEGQTREAIWCWQRVPSAEEASGVIQGWPREAVKGPRDWLGRLAERERAAEKEALDSLTGARSAARWMMAQAFLDTGRLREAALVIEALGSAEGDTAAVMEYTLAECWMGAGHPLRALRCAESWLERRGGAPAEAEACELAGRALRALGRTAEARETFRAVFEIAGASALGCRARLWEAICCLDLEKPEETLLLCQDLFEDKRTPREVAAAALYWKGMAECLQEWFGAARRTMEAYLKDWPDGLHAGDAAFRRAFTFFAEMEYAEARQAVEVYLANHPGHESSGEALLLLGDTLLAEGKLDEGLQCYDEIPATDSRIVEEGIFRAVEALRLAAQFEPMRERLVRFLEERPESARLPEAIHWMGWLREREGDQKKAAAAYWEALQRFGDRWECLAVEDLLVALLRIDRSADGGGLAVRLEELEREAENGKRRVLFVRCLWARALLLERSDPGPARVLLQRAGREADPALQHPRVLLDSARAEREAGNILLARKRAWDLCRWHPRASQRGEAEALCGDLALESGEKEKAAEHLRRAERLLVDPAELARVRLLRARMLTGDLGKPGSAPRTHRASADEAKGLLEELLADPASPASCRAEALLVLGRLTRASGSEQKALAIFERVYLLYAGQRSIAAESYLERARTLEVLGKSREALEVYQALLSHEELQGEGAVREARDRLAVLKSASQEGTP
ncbi:MAG TPA: outer membrane protein assembly factor BamD [Verrucomicrobiales bacterium]|nr:outer membrane protein assembly factor BamD [Verrucomicrobiales bacterium]